MVEAVSYCHTTLGRINRWGTAPDMMRRLKEQSVTRKRAEAMGEDEKRGKIIRGVFVDRDIPEYTQLYEQVIERAQAGLPSSSPSPRRGGEEVV